MQTYRIHYVNVIHLYFFSRLTNSQPQTPLDQRPLLFVHTNMTKLNHQAPLHPLIK